MTNLSGNLRLRVGIISDVQGYDFPQDWGMHNCEKAIRILAEKKIDVLLMAGDLADGGDSVAPLQYYQDMLHRYFGEKMPVQINCAGNHDFWTHGDSRSQEQVYRDFCAIAGDPAEDPIRKTIAGYDFIAFSTDNKRDYNETECERLLRPVIADAVARDPGKPVFVVTHYHPAGTVTGSYNCGRKGLRNVMNDYPQVVSFSGHTHCPLEDERCIWQGEFTAVNTASLSYACVEDRCANLCGPIVPFAREALGFMYMEIYDDRLEIHRYNAEDGREIKPDRIWNVALPYSPEKAVYTDARKELRKAPEFEAGTEVYFRIDFGYSYLIFDGAEHDDFTHFYRIDITELKDDGTTEEPMSFRFLSPTFYRLQRNQDHRQVFKVPPNTIEKGKKYRFDVYPVETFGLEGKPISLTISVPPHYTINNSTPPSPQE